MQLRYIRTLLWSVTPLVSIVWTTQIKWTKYEFKVVPEGFACGEFIFLQDDVADSFACSNICFLQNNCFAAEFDPETFRCIGCSAFKRHTLPLTENLILLARLDYHMDCKDILEKDEHAKSGVYEIRLHNLEPTDVYCDMETDGGGWTIIQRRSDSSVDFNRTFEEYENGFGNIDGEFWLGLRYIRELTDVPSYLILSVGSNPDISYAIFKIVRENYVILMAVDPAVNKYNLPVYAPFSTYDNDNTLGCARSTGGGWWFSDDTCLLSNLNGKIKQNTSEKVRLNETRMMVRRPKAYNKG